jgi:hypothetical protein
VVTLSRLSPVERDCPRCGGVGWERDDMFKLCLDCGGVGKTWIPGAPGFGCKIVLGKRKVGEIVTLGNGDRGRIVRHDKRGAPRTSVALIGDFDDIQAEEATSYPSATGVVSVSDPRWHDDDSGHAHSREDQADPIRKAI